VTLVTCPGGTSKWKLRATSVGDQPAPLEASGLPRASSRGSSRGRKKAPGDRSPGAFCRDRPA
jgi:hypothetical protein